MMTARETTKTRRLGKLVASIGVLALLATVAGTIAPLAPAASAAPLSGVDLSTYVRVGRYDLPEPTRTVAPANSLLAQEASAVTYDWDTDTMFVVGDGGTSVVQVTKTGQLLNSMSLPPGGSPQGTEFYDTEGLTYTGNGQFVLTEERDRQVVKFTYVAGGTLTRAAAQTVKLGTTIGNIGLEGVANDPQTGGFILVKEKTPESIFQTNIDFAAGTATNGSPTTVASVNLFDPSLVGTSDFSDVFSLSNLTTLTGPDSSHLLVISQESGKVVNVDRSGNVSSTLTIQADPGSPLSVPDMTMEGVTMDNDGTLYIANENGGGDSNHPQLWVYKPSNAPNLAPTGVVLSNTVSSVPENTSTQGGLKVADITVLDDGLGANSLSVSGPDASSFQIIGGGLFIVPGTVLDFETKTTYDVTVNVDDSTVGSTPDASTPFTLTVTDVANETAAAGTVVISEVNPWSSGNSPVAADWFEMTNLGGTPVNLTGWRMDDNSFSAGSSVALRGTWNAASGSSNPVGSLAPGESRIFFEGAATASSADNTIGARFATTWFNGTLPAGLSLGYYGGSGVGLSTGGDGVALFNSSSSLVTAVSFGTSTAPPTLRTFDNSAGLGSSTAPGPTLTTLSSVGVHGAFNAAHPTAGSTEAGSPGADFLPPTFTDVPFGVTAEATGASTSVSYTAPTATDLLNGNRPVTCVPASGAAFPVGTSTVTCSASDLAGNIGTTSFPVVVRDATPPTIALPTDVTVSATGAETPVAFGPVTANDAVDGVLAASCSPASPGPFPIGTTHIDCFALDSHSNRSSGSFSVTVDPAASTTVVSSDANPAAFGQPVTLTAAVTDADAVASGTVEFFDGGTPLGSASLDGSGQATLPTPGLSVGAHSITAAYAGDAVNAGSISAPRSQVVVAADTTVTLTHAPTAPDAGSTVTLTATVGVVAPGTGGPTGSVDFTDNGSPIGTASLSGGQAQIDLPLGATDLSVHSIVATYAGSATFNASSSAADLVSGSPQAPVVTSDPSSQTVNPGQPFSFSAAASGLPVPSVQWQLSTDGGATFADIPGATSLSYGGTATVADNGHQFRVVFTNEAGSVATAAATLTVPSTVVTLASSVNPSTAGQAVSFSVQVSIVGVATRSTTGTVSFYDGSTLLGTKSVMGGKATLAYVVLGAGSHAVTAVFVRGVPFVPVTSNPVSQTVDQAATTITLSPPAGTAPYAQPIVLKAAVKRGAPGAGVVRGGTVEFFDGGVSLGTATVKSGTATLPAIAALAVGDHPITAVFSGTADDQASSSVAPFTQTVVASATAVAVLSNSLTPRAGQSVTIKATVKPVAPSKGLISGGVVLFYDNGVFFASAAVVKGVVALPATRALVVGTHVITSTFSGPPERAGAASAPITVTVSPADTAVTLTSSAPVTTQGHAGTLTAVVKTLAPGYGVPTGTFTFYDGGVPIATVPVTSAGKATLALSTLSVGVHAITVSYDGSADRTPSTSTTLPQTIT